MPQGSVDASNAILISGEPLVDELEVKTASEMYPGRFVIKDTDDQSIQIAGAGAKNVLGVLDVKADKTRDTIYAQGDQARVLRGAIRVMVLLVNGQTVAKGDGLVVAANGKVTAASALSVVVASGSTAVLSTSAQPTIAPTGSIPNGGTIVADADESTTASGDTWIRAMLRI